MSQAQSLHEWKDIGWQALGPAIACTGLASLVVIARWYTRHRLAECVGLDDYAIVVSLALSWAMTAVIGAEVHEGVGVYSPPVDAVHIAKLTVVSNNIWIIIVNITKASILLQYLRIFSSRAIRILSYLLLSALLPAACWAVFGGTFLCTPIQKLWTPQIPGHCMNGEKYWLSVAGIDIGLDFLVLLLPMPAVGSLRLPRRQKIGLVLVFLLGFFVCVVSIVRLVTVLVTSDDGDMVASGIWAIVWSAVEANVGIICASLLALKPLVAKIFPAVVQETKPPRHSMRLPRVGTLGPWQDGDSDDATLACPPGASRSSTPTTWKSKESRLLQRSSASKVVRGLHMSEAAVISETQSGQTPAPVRKRSSEAVDILEMLRQAEDGGEDPRRRSSHFREHL